MIAGFQGWGEPKLQGFSRPRLGTDRPSLPPYSLALQSKSQGQACSHSGLHLLKEGATESRSHVCNCHTCPLPSWGAEPIDEACLRILRPSHTGGTGSTTLMHTNSEVHRPGLASWLHIDQTCDLGKLSYLSGPQFLNPKMGIVNIKFNFIHTKYLGGVWHMVNVMP